MDFHSRTLELSLPPERVQEILIGEEHVSSIDGHADFFKPLAVYLTWTRLSDTRLESSVSYFRSKNLCVFRVFADIEPAKGGSRVTLSSGHGTWSQLLMGAAWVMGFCMCVIGAIIPWLQSKAYSHQLKTMVEKTGDALEVMALAEA
jgi:hypothetical protein